MLKTTSCLWLISGAVRERSTHTHRYTYTDTHTHTQVCGHTQTDRLSDTHRKERRGGARAGQEVGGVGMRVEKPVEEEER